MADSDFTWDALASQPLCVADFEVDGPILSVGRSPFSDRRVGYVTGGSFKGARFNGDILPGGGNWSHGGELTPGVAVGAFDARTLWRTGDGATIYVSYTGRSVISDTVIARLRGSDANTVPPSDYYIRIAPVFETEDRRYAWLNGILAVGCGQKTPFGIRHWIFSIL